MLSIKFCSKLSCWQGWLVHCLDNPERRTEAEKPSQRGGIANRKFFARIYKSPESLRAVWKVEGSHAMDGNLCQPRISKSDEFSEKFQTAFDPPPPHFWKVTLQLFLTGYEAFKSCRNLIFLKSFGYWSINKRLWNYLSALCEKLGPKL